MTKDKTQKDARRYLTGFGNHFSSEAIAGALPPFQNSPQHPPLGLYAEQISGTSFTRPHAFNRRTWCYRILPSVTHSEFSALEHSGLATCHHHAANPTQLRWANMPKPNEKMDFIESLRCFVFNGSPHLQFGGAVYLYACNQSMTQRYFYNADGECLFVPQVGKLTLHTELGILDVAPGEIAVIPRGIKFQVELFDDFAYGYLCENYGELFNLPERGPIGANGLANERDFECPVAAYQDRAGEFELICKNQQQLWRATISHSPLDVVAWHGNYVPYKYNLKRFCAMNSVTFDHSDPSIFTVLTSASDVIGMANIDFVIFPTRWVVAEHTFRPPYYHRNVMSEFMGLIYGEYDAKADGFKPGGASLHNCMTPHGPDVEAFEKASQDKLKPEYYKDTLAFMFESRYPWQPTEFAMNASFRDKNYLKCWQSLPRKFKSVD